MKRKGLLIRMDEDQLYEFKAWCAKFGISMSSAIRWYIDNTLRQEREFTTIVAAMVERQQQCANSATGTLHAEVAQHDALLEEVERRAYADAHQTDEDEEGGTG